MSEMTGIALPELVIYCEDVFARIVVQEAVPDELRGRLKILDVGDKNKVIQQGVCHVRGEYASKVLCVLDGDCTDQWIRRRIDSERGHRTDIELECLTLPGSGLNPEKWVLDQLVYPDYTDALASEIGCTSTVAQAHVQALRVLHDSHNIGFALHERTGLDKTDCLHRVARAVVPRHPQLDDLRECISSLLD